MKYYVGHHNQTRGAERYKLQGGKGHGMEFLYVRNGQGLELWISLDRCGDMTRVVYNGKNMGYLSPCGHVSSAHYQRAGSGFLKSFSAGFFTTCGFENVGGGCVDEGEEVALHGTIGNTPAELLSIDETEDELKIKLAVRDSVIFTTRYLLERTYIVSYKENVFSVNDTVTNEGEYPQHFYLLYHCNMGYPLLSENSIFRAPHEKIWANTDIAKDNIDTALELTPPRQGYKERCYLFDPKVNEKDGLVHTGIWGTDAEVGVVFKYKKEELPCLTEWKQMGRRDYVLGIEPGNSYPCPRSKKREKGELNFLEPDCSNKTAITFRFVDNKADFDSEF